MILGYYQFLLFIQIKQFLEIDDDLRICYQFLFFIQIKNIVVITNLTIMYTYSSNKWSLNSDWFRPCKDDFFHHKRLFIDELKSPETIYFPLGKRSINSQVRSQLIWKYNFDPLIFGRVTHSIRTVFLNQTLNQTF